MGGKKIGGGELQGKEGILSSAPEWMIGFQPNMVGINLMGGGSKLVQLLPMGPEGAQGVGSKGAKHFKFPTPASPDLEAEQSSFSACRYLNK